MSTRNESLRSSCRKNGTCIGDSGLPCTPSGQSHKKKSLRNERSRTMGTGGERTPSASGYAVTRTTIIASQSMSAVSGVNRHRQPAVPGHMCNPIRSQTWDHKDQNSACPRQKRRSDATAAVLGGRGGDGNSGSKYCWWWFLVLLIPCMVGVYHLSKYYVNDQGHNYGKEITTVQSVVVSSPRSSPGGGSSSGTSGPVPFTPPGCPSSDPIQTVHNYSSTASFQPCPGCPTNEPPSCISCPSYDDTEMAKRDDYLKQKVVTLEKQFEQLSDRLVQLEAEIGKVRGEMEKINGTESFQEVHLIVDKYLKKRMSDVEDKLGKDGDTIDTAISKYDADKTGRPDLALESGGGSVVSTRCTKKSDFVDSTITFWGLPIYYPINSPRKVIQPGVMPGDCWSFDGAEAEIVLKLVGPTRVSGFTVEHLPKSLSPLGHIDSAPKKFFVVGLTNYEDPSTEFVFGEYQYEDNNVPIQYFVVQNKSDTYFQFVEMKILSNHGNLQYTCLYRLRIHGYLESWVGLLKS